MGELAVLDEKQIKTKIYTIRGLQVILDADLAELYNVDTGTLNQAVKRNIERFPGNFMFQLTESELRNLRCQNGTSKEGQNLISQSVISSWGGRRTPPYAFTEQGVAMLSGVLKSNTAVKVSIQIMGAFVAMRRFIASNAEVFQRLGRVEIKQAEHDEKFEIVFKAIESKDIIKKQGIFFDGQAFDAYKFASDLVRSAKESIILIDNYIDDSVLILFSKRKKNVSVTIYTKNITNQLKLDLDKFNSQYPVIDIKAFKDSHDRFMIIDNKEVYHFGASLKDLGKKWFAFSKFDKEAFNLLGKL